MHILRQGKGKKRQHRCYETPSVGPSNKHVFMFVERNENNDQDWSGKSQLVKQPWDGFINYVINDTGTNYA